MDLQSLPGLQQFNLSEKVAIITGGSKGLGLAMAAGLASSGANIVIVNRDAAAGKAAAKLIADNYPVTAMGIKADVTSQKKMEKMATSVIKKMGRIDILINNAGINIRGRIEDLSYADFQKVMKVNVDGIWLASRAVVPYMKKQRGGRIINLASTLGLVGLANRTPYTSSKGAVVQMTRALGIELATSKINVNAICPGPFLTEMNIPIANTKEAKKFIVGATALNRWGKLKEIQGAAIFLASDAASYMVGSTVTVDGGWTAQ